MKYQVQVKPGSSQEKIIEDGDNLIIYLRAKAHDGEANSALIKLLSKHFHVGKTCVVVIQGAKSRNKNIEILK